MNKIAGAFETVIRRNGFGYLWLVMDRLGGELSRGRARTLGLAHKAARAAKVDIIQRIPSYGEHLTKSVQKRHLAWTQRRNLEPTVKWKRQSIHA